MNNGLMDVQCGDGTQRMLDMGGGGLMCVYYTAVQTKTGKLTGPSAELVFGENHIAPGSMSCVRLRGTGFCGFYTVLEVLKYWIKEYEVEKK